MKIESLKVLDRNAFTEESSYKVFLMDKIIEHYLPVFCKNVDRKKNQLNENMGDLSKLKSDINQIKIKLKNFVRRINTEEIKKKILVEIQLLSNKDLLYGRNKQVVKNVMTSFNNGENLKDKLMLIKSIK